MEDETKEEAEGLKTFINHDKDNSNEKDLLFFHMRLLK